MNKWKEVSLNDICEYISRGITPSYTDQSGVIVLNQKCIRNNRVSYEQSRLTNPDKKKINEDKFLRSYDILVNSTGVGTLGRVAQVKEIVDKTTVDSHVTIVRADKSVNSRFIGYNLFLQQPNIEALAEGSTGQTELSRTRLSEAIKILLPPLSEQKAIADTLSCLDDKIELNNCMNKTLEEMAQAIFKSWFVDFEPFQDGEFEDSELGSIPKGWKVGKLGEIFDFKNGKKRPDTNGIYPVYGGNGVLGLSNEYNNENVVIIGRVGAYCGSLFLENNRCWISDNAISAKSKTNNLAFCYYNLKRLELNKLRIGTGQPLLTQSILNNIISIIPSNDVIESFDSLILQLLNVIDNNNKENLKLKGIRDSLLPKLMSGEIRVPIEEVK